MIDAERAHFVIAKSLGHHERQMITRDAVEFIDQSVIPSIIESYGSYLVGDPDGFFDLDYAARKFRRRLNRIGRKWTRRSVEEAIEMCGIIFFCTPPIALQAEQENRAARALPDETSPGEPAPG